MTNTATVLTSATRSSFGKVTLVTTDASGNTYTSAFNLADAALSAPVAPTLATATSGGTVLAGTYTVAISYVDSAGETVASAVSTQATTGSTSTLTVTAPAAAGDATGWYAYVSQVGGTSLTRQQTAGTPSLIGTNLVLTAPPTSSGAAPLTVGTAADAPVSSLIKALFTA